MTPEPQPLHSAAIEAVPCTTGPAQESRLLVLRRFAECLATFEVAGSWTFHGRASSVSLRFGLFTCATYILNPNLVCEHSQDQDGK